MVLPRGLAPRASAFAERRAELLHFGSYELNESKTLRHAGAAPAPAVWKTAVLAVTPMTHSGQWWLLPVSHRTPLGFNEVLIYLSYTASGPSARYCAAVSRLSGAGSAFELRRNEEWSPDEVMLPGLPDVSRPFSF